MQYEHMAGWALIMKVTQGNVASDPKSSIKLFRARKHHSDKYHRAFQIFQIIGAKYFECPCVEG